MEPVTRCRGIGRRAVNYYNRHIGDYTRDTAHLSMIEDGAYTRLLDLYYTREGPLPDSEVERLCRCHGAKERAALRRILNEFFTKTDCKTSSVFVENNKSEIPFWIHKRCENEILDYERKCKISHKNGKKGGRPKTQRVISGYPRDNPDHNLNESNPVASSQEPISITPPPPTSPPQNGIGGGGNGEQGETEKLLTGVGVYPEIASELSKTVTLSDAKSAIKSVVNRNGVKSRGAVVTQILKGTA
jgi:uncharacterized protein YdaU (DUF1376 family)